MMMNTGFRNSFIFFTLITLLSCNGKQQTHTIESGSDFFTHLPPDYDPGKVDPKAPVVEVSITTSGNTMADMKFDLDTISVPAGSTVRLFFSNNSTDLSMQHNLLVIDSSAVQEVADAALKAGKEKQFKPLLPAVFVGTRLTGPGETDTILFPAPTVGFYKFICSYPGHYSKMQGVFMVR